MSFEVPSVSGKWQGAVSSDQATPTGSLSQGAEAPLIFRREIAFHAAEKPSHVDGIWLGALEARGAKLRLQVQVKSDRDGTWKPWSSPFQILKISPTSTGTGI